MSDILKARIVELRGIAEQSAKAKIVAATNEAQARVRLAECEELLASVLKAAKTTNEELPAAAG